MLGHWEKMTVYKQRRQASGEMILISAHNLISGFQVVGGRILEVRDPPPLAPASKNFTHQLNPPAWKGCSGNNGTSPLDPSDPQKTSKLGRGGSWAM